MGLLISKASGPAILPRRFTKDIIQPDLVEVLWNTGGSPNS